MSKRIVDQVSQKIANGYEVSPEDVDELLAWAVRAREAMKLVQEAA